MEVGLEQKTEGIEEKSQDRKVTALHEETTVKTTMVEGEITVGRLLTYSFWKGVFDRLVALCVIVVLSPLLALIAIGIRIDSPGSSLFQQERVGKDGQRYILYKFRTMNKDHDVSKYHEYMQQYVQENSACLFNESGDDKFELINDPRITRVGSQLRRLNLDEFPQLINMLKGEMSLIGPRPDIPLAVEFYKEHHKQRFQP